MMNVLTQKEVEILTRASPLLEFDYLKVVISKKLIKKTLTSVSI